MQEFDIYCKNSCIQYRLCNISYLRLSLKNIKESKKLNSCLCLRPLGSSWLRKGIFINHLIRGSGVLN